MPLSVSRSLRGDTFFEIYPSGNWGHAWELFWNDKPVLERYVKGLPFQVFACWNGGVTFSAGPLLGIRPQEKEAKTHAESEAAAEAGDVTPAGPSGSRWAGNETEKVRFRVSAPDECFMGEPTLLCKDFWYAGYGRIAVVPTVNFQYTDEAGEKLKQVKGYAAQLVAQENVDDTRIEWQDEPPDTVKCMPTWAEQTWVPWNQSLPLGS
ncbi:glycosyltransferase family 69 protein [Xylariaceae sp. FL0804]|nr:glycosyltransferase family 69 protein [Xylariaceae sp. FL0804]